MSRPLKNIDWKIFEQLCHIQCTQAEIASFLNLNVDTLHDRVKREYKQSYSETYKRFSEGGKCSLRRHQWKMAEKNCSMAIWLGKQYLGQKDQEEQKQSPNDSMLDTLKQLIAENKILKDKLDAIEPKTTSEHAGSEKKVQYLGGSGI